MFIFTLDAMEDILEVLLFGLTFKKGSKKNIPLIHSHILILPINLLLLSYHFWPRILSFKASLNALWEFWALLSVLENTLTVAHLS